MSNSENFEFLIDSILFRFSSIFKFSHLSIINKFLKFMLLLIFGIPFILMEIIGLIFALFSYFPFFGIIFAFTVCLLCDFITSGLFYLIMIPDIKQIKNNNLKSQNNYYL